MKLFTTVTDTIANGHWKAIVVKWDNAAKAYVHLCDISQENWDYDVARDKAIEVASQYAATGDVEYSSVRKFPYPISI